jgi:hypothetical protein
MRFLALIVTLLLALFLSAPAAAQVGVRVGASSLEASALPAVQYPLTLPANTAIATTAASMLYYNGIVLSATNGPVLPLQASGQVVNAQVVYKTDSIKGITVKVLKNGSAFLSFTATTTTTGSLQTFRVEATSGNRFKATDKLTANITNSGDVSGTMTLCHVTIGLLYDPGESGTANQTLTLYRISIPSSAPSAIPRDGLHPSLGIYFAGGVGYTRDATIRASASTLGYELQRQE